MPSHPVEPPEWIDSAPVLVEQAVDIAASPDDVWVHIADHQRWPEWFEALKSVEVIGAGVGVGGMRRVTLKGPPADEEFTAWKPGEHFAFAVTSTKIPILHTMAEEVRLEPIETGCRVCYRQGIELRKGFGWLGKPLAGQMSKQLGAALSSLAKRCES